MVSDRTGAFTLRCLLDDCNRMRAFYYLGGQVNSEVTVRDIPYYTMFKLQHGFLGNAADLIRDAIELHLVGQMNTDAAAKDGAYRGAAVHLRVAAQLVAGYVMMMSESDLRNFNLSQLIGKLRKGQSWPRIREGQLSEVLSSLDYVLRLGDTAAHQYLKDPSREVPPTRGNLGIGFDEIDRVAYALEIS
ncbi:MAG TPA: hypothetical protein VE955_12215 [Candidatus Dormibacteraeota bacterium]|jgi:hypothetical protein|nr:hypothetical protein [Candidatus Dormibacteraeota bacterium]